MNLNKEGLKDVLVVYLILGITCLLAGLLTYLATQVSPNFLSLLIIPVIVMVTVSTYRDGKRRDEKERKKKNGKLRSS